MLRYPGDTFASHFADVNGVRLHYKKAGAGPACLLLHGYPETWYTWRHLIPVLAKQFTVYAPDFRGWGDSDKQGPYSLRVMVEDTLALMDHWGHAKYHVVGHDWGGAVTFALSKVAPERLAKMASVNMPVKRFDPTKPLHFYVFNTPLLPEMLMGMASDRVVAFILRWWSHNHAAFTPEVLRAYQDNARQPGANAASRGYYRATFRSVLARRKSESYGLGETQKMPPPIPWLCLWGTRDRVSPLANAEYFKQDVPGVPVHYIEDAGHFPQEEQPEVFNREVVSFFTAG